MAVNEKNYQEDWVYKKIWRILENIRECSHHKVFANMQISKSLNDKFLSLCVNRQAICGNKTEKLTSQNFAFNIELI